MSNETAEQYADRMIVELENRIDALAREVEQKNREISTLMDRATKALDQRDAAKADLATKDAEVERLLDECRVANELIEALSNAGGTVPATMLPIVQKYNALVDARAAAEQASPDAVAAVIDAMYQEHLAGLPAQTAAIRAGDAAQEARTR